MYDDLTNYPKPLTDTPEESFTLPNWMYTDPAVYELEKERIFYRTWQYVGHKTLFQKLPNNQMDVQLGDRLNGMRCRCCEVIRRRFHHDPAALNTAERRECRMVQQVLQARWLIGQPSLWRFQHQHIARPHHQCAAKQMMRVVKSVTAMRGLVPALFVVRADSQIGVRDNPRAAHDATTRCSNASTAQTWSG